MSEKNEKEILETLVGLTGAVGSRFDKIDGHLEKLDLGVVELHGDMDRQFADMRSQLDRVEHLILEEHARRLEALERSVGISK